MILLLWFFHTISILRLTRFTLKFIESQKNMLFHSRLIFMISSLYTYNGIIFYFISRVVLSCAMDLPGSLVIEAQLAQLLLWKIFMSLLDYAIPPRSVLVHPLRHKNLGDFSSCKRYFSNVVNWISSKLLTVFPPAWHRYLCYRVKKSQNARRASA